jgi:potassium-transporting ATPase KdpC subunit
MGLFQQPVKERFMGRELFIAFRILLVLTILTGLIYPAVVTGLANLLFKDQAQGSLLTRDGKIVGSALLGQGFKKPEYFHPRPSAAGSDGYDAGNSGGTNLGPTSKKLVDQVKASVAAFRKENPQYSGAIPADLLTTSASGLDPHISLASAKAQLPRVAASRQISASRLENMLLEHTEKPDLGFLGEYRVNVLLLNLALDQEFPVKNK